jgi:diacylglycerol O-acyltransferase / trehalose O-mycolyltransferase
MRGAAVVLAVIALVGCGEQTATPPKPAATTAATVVRERQVAPRIVDLEVRSPALDGTAKVRLLTPDGWAKGRGRWPVLYLLHGCCDTYVSWTRSTDIESWPQLRKVLVVMPDGGDVGFYSDWRSGPAWETFHLTELRRLLERDYGAGARRAIAGLSMGGLGAIDYAARDPHLFRAAASFSGLLHPLGDPDGLLGLFAAYTDDPDAVWGDPGSDRDTWAEHDPTELVDELRGISLFVSAGDGRPGPLDPRGQEHDRIEPGVRRQSRAFAARLRDLGIDARTDFYGAGTHSWPYWQRELRRALPTLLSG